MKWIALILSGLLAASATAKDGGPSTEGTAARVAISNALVTALKDSKQISFRLKWNYLPRTTASQSFIFPNVTNDRHKTADQVSDQKLTSAEIKLSNADLVSNASVEAWEKRQRASGSKAYLFLLNALSAGAPATDLRHALSEGYRFWAETPVDQTLGWNDLDSLPKFRWSNWTKARRDFFCMYYLLGGSTTDKLDPHPFGVLLTPSIQPRGAETLAFRNDCDWTIGVEPATVQGITGQSHPFFRFYVSVTSPVVKQLFNTATDTTVTYKVRAGLLQHRQDVFVMEPATISATNSTEPISLDAVVPESAGLGPDNTTTTSVGEQTLSTFTNINPSTLFDNLFTSGAARPFTGGLIGNGVATNIFGLNYPLDEEETFGIIYGIVPKRNNAFYVGPSLHLGIFDFSVGARVFGRDDGVTTARLAGALSIDLASAFTKPKPPIEMTPGPSPGGLWQDTDALVGDNGFAVLEAVGSDLQQPDLDAGLKVTTTYTVATTDHTVAIVVRANAAGPMVLEGFLGTLGTGSQVSRMLPAGNYDVKAPTGFHIRQISPKDKASDVAGYVSTEFKDSVSIRVDAGRARAFRFAVRKT